MTRADAAAPRGAVVKTQNLGPTLLAPLALAACGAGATASADLGAEPDAGPAPPPETRILDAPPDVVERPVVIAFESDRPAEFECRMDAAGFGPCESPVEFFEVTFGPHRFEVRARSGDLVDGTPASADFTVVQNAAYPNLAIIEASEGWESGAGGLALDVSAWPAQIRPFFDLYPDDYMAVVLLTDFLATNVVPFATLLNNDIAGIGLEYDYGAVGSYDVSATAGSAGRLEVAVFMQSPLQYWEYFAGYWPWKAAWLDVLAQEVGHRWLARFRLPAASDTEALLDNFEVHWTWNLALDAPSPLGAYFTGPVGDLGGGEFRLSVFAGPHAYAALDLYAMGLLPADDVPDFFWVRDPEPPAPPDFPALVAAGSWDFSGERVDVAAQEMLEAMGPRDPPAGEVPTMFRQAFVVAIRPGEKPRPETLDWVDGARRDWELHFAKITGGRGAVDTALFDTTRGR